MVKRNVGERARILFDDIDLKILRLLNNNSEHGYNVFYSVMDLADKLFLKHKNLKPHLDKLLMLELVSVSKGLDGKTIVLSEINTKRKIIEQDYKTKEDYIKALKEEEKKKALLFYLEKTNLFLATDNAMKNTEFDIRKMKRKTSIGSIITTKQAIKIINDAFS
jgi:DNA-binding MarR family transcriptional regulator